MRILVTGASGFVGSAVCAALTRNGNTVIHALRKTPQEQGAQLEVAVGDIGPDTQWAVALRGVEVVIHLAARVHVMREGSFDPLAEFRKVNVAGTERLACAAVAQGVRRFVYVSSVGVHGKKTEGKRLTEEHSLAPYSPYTKSKLEAEQALYGVAKQTGLELTIVRPPLVYGPNNPGNFLRLLRLVELGLPLPLGSVKNQRSMIYVGNLADALTTCAMHAQAAAKTYLVSDGQDLSTPQLMRTLAHLLGVPCRLWPFPPTLLRIAAKLSGTSEQVDALTGSLVIDSSRIRQELGWSPPYTLEEGLRDTVRWYRMNRR